MFPEALPV
jgi:hypothetical protein